MVQIFVGVFNVVLLMVLDDVVKELAHWIQGDSSIAVGSVETVRLVVSCFVFILEDYQCFIGPILVMKVHYFVSLLLLCTYSYQLSYEDLKVRNLLSKIMSHLL